MGKQNLKNALRTAGLTPEEFAAIIQVDPKTVQRWVAGTTTPYRRHRAAISRALSLSEHDLWPVHASGQPDGETDNETGGGTAASCDVNGTWAHADHQDAPDLAAFINDTTGPIDVLDSCCGLHLTDEITDALLEQTDAGRRVRILTDGQAPHWEALLDHPQIAIFLCEIPGEYWLIKTPDRMLLTINLEHEAGMSQPPILELSPVSEDGLFARLTTRFDELWAPTDEHEPSDPAPDPTLAEDDGRHHAADPDSSPPQTATGVLPAEPGGRRWPRQPA